MSLEMINKVKKLSLTEEIAAELRKSILSGKLKPNTRLYEKELAEQLGVSRGPLREALRLLEGEGMISSTTGRGSFVNSFSARKVAELYSMRLVLEQEAVRLAARRATDRQLNELEQILNNMLQAGRKGKVDQVIELDLQYHEKIWELADHELLAEILLGLSSQIRSYMAVHTSLYEDLADGIENHKILFNALKERNENASANLMKQHLIEATEVVTKFAKAQDQQIM
jgi:DNA-binding GntR family transcriptional regulator